MTVGRVLSIIQISVFICDQSTGPENLFVNYLSRIHREEVCRKHIRNIRKDILLLLLLLLLQNLSKAQLTSLHWQDFDFVLKGLARLLTNPLTQTYLPNSTKKIQFHQELLVLFWKLCDFNKVGTKNHNEVLFALRFCALLFNRIPSVCVPTAEVPVFCPEEQ